MTDARPHALYGSSGAHRLLACYGSLQAQRGRVDVPRDASDEGTKAHEMLALSLTEGLAKVRGASNVDPDMLAAVEVVHDYLENIFISRAGNDVVVLVEQPLAFPQSTVDESDVQGIADLMVVDNTEHDAWAIEFKYGMLPVEVPRNPQLMFNATGLLWREPIRTLTLVVIQPRVTWHADGVVREWKCGPVEIAEFQIEFERAIAASLQPNAPRTPGPHCRYCLAELDCPARVGAAVSVISPTATVEDLDGRPPEPSGLSDERMAYVLRNADRLREWMSAVEKEAHRRAMSGQPVPGHKLVEARASRKYAQPASVVANEMARISGLPAETFLRTTALPVTDAEAKVIEAVRAAAPMGQKDAAVRAAKEQMAWLAPRAAQGNTVLVPEHDPRPAVSRTAAFKGVDILPQE